MRYSLMSGAGNRFAVVDAIRGPAPADPGAVARGLGPARVDGLILVRPPRASGDFRMEVWNADGSRPETCGNGLRCVAKLAFERGHVRGREFTIETDAGPARARVELAGGKVVRARVHMGPARLLALDEPLPAAGREFRVALADMGNPHCVVLVEDERRVPIESWGPALEHHARFPRGTNVEFVALRGEGVFLRVWERGVGETQACGSGACATAAVLREKGLARLPVEIALPGGVLVVEDAADGLALTGPVEEHGSGEWRGA